MMIIEAFRKMQAVLFTCLCVVFCISSAASSAEESFWRVSQEQFSCIVDNSRNYMEHGDDPIVIMVMGCPEADLSKAMAASAVNSGTFEVMDGDPVIILTKREFQCLIESKDLVAVSGEIRIPREGICLEN